MEKAIIGMAMAGLTLLIQMTFHPRMILSWYFQLLCKLHVKGSILRYLSKLLGICPYCYGFWLCIGIGTILIGFNEQLFIIVGFWYLTIELTLNQVPGIIHFVPKEKLYNEKELTINKRKT